MSIDRLSADDALMVRADTRWPQDIGALAILDGAPLIDSAGQLRIDAVRAAIGSRLYHAPRFRQILYEPRRRGLGGPLWVDAPAFDISEHINAVPLPANSGEDELLAAVERLRGRRLDRSRPLWEMWLMPGLPHGQVGLYVRMHHAIADGMAAMATIGKFLDADSDVTAGSARPWTPQPPPSARRLIADNVFRHVAGFARGVARLAHPRSIVRGAFGIAPAMRELLAEQPSTKTSLDRLVGPDRRLALVRSRLDLVKQIAHAYDATVNDVLLAATAAGLHALLRDRREGVEGVTLRVSVPISMRRGESGTAQGNLITEMVVPLHLGACEPGERLRQIAGETARRKPRPRPSLGALFGNPIVMRLILKLVARQRENVTTTNIRGPQAPLYLAGARMLEVFPLLNLFGNQSLGVGALSYAGAFNIGVIADGAGYHDIEVFTAGVRDELHALADPTHVWAFVDRVAVLA
jgi:WS/DGAT/MGAT family acyltransferase